MTVARAVSVLVAMGIGLSLLSLTVGFVLTAAIGARTVAGAIRRGRRRPAALGELNDAFPIGMLAELDEALERCLLDVERSPTSVETPRTP